MLMSNWQGNFLWRCSDATAINFYCKFKICVPAGNTNRLWCNCLLRKTEHHNYTCSWLDISLPLKSWQYSQCYNYTISPPFIFPPLPFLRCTYLYWEDMQINTIPHPQTPGIFFIRPWLCFHRGFKIISD